MAYKRTNWKKGDKISSERLNNIEDGIEEALKAISWVNLNSKPISVASIEGNANTAVLTSKINELIKALTFRGILTS